AALPAGRATLVSCRSTSSLLCATRLLFFFLRPRRPPTSPLFPYTTLFRSSPPAAAGRDPRGDGFHIPAAHDKRRIERLGCGIHRSEEHTSELQSLTNLVCRLLLEKKKKLPLAPRDNMTDTSAGPQRTPADD